MGKLSGPGIRVLMGRPFPRLHPGTRLNSFGTGCGKAGGPLATGGPHHRPLLRPSQPRCAAGRVRGEGQEEGVAHVAPGLVLPEQVSVPCGPKERRPSHCQTIPRKRPLLSRLLLPFSPLLSLLANSTRPPSSPSTSTCHCPFIAVGAVFHGNAVAVVEGRVVLPSLLRRLAGT